MKLQPIFVVILTTFLNLNAQEAISGIDKLLIRNEAKNIAHKNNNRVEDSIKQYNTFLKALKNQIQAENKISGTLGFGLGIQNSENQDLSQFNISAKGTKGFYPGEFKFDSRIVTQVQDGQFIENLSNLSMSYDHHLGRSLASEGYIFIKRTTNNFLNIDQRYEVGSGIVWNFFLSGKGVTKNMDRLERRLTPKGQKKLKALTSYIPKKGKALSEENDDENLKLCNDNICLSDLENLTELEKTKIKKEIRRSIFSVIKQESKVRASLLGGLNYETERTTDSLRLRFRRDSIRKQSFAPVNLVRAVIAPGVELKIDQFELTSRAYFKLAISDNDLTSEVIMDDLTNKKTDYRIEWVNSASLKFNNKISVTATLNYVEINAPRRRFFVVNGENQLFVAAKRFTNFNVGFEYKL